MKTVKTQIIYGTGASKIPDAIIHMLRELREAGGTGNYHGQINKLDGKVVDHDHIFAAIPKFRSYCGASPNAYVSRCFSVT
ncbi:MAG: hypothetical protein QM492_08130 [Rhodobacterales bacterium]